MLDSKELTKPDASPGQTNTEAEVADGKIVAQKPAIENEKQAKAVFEAIRDSWTSTQIEKAKQIVLRYEGRLPFDPQKLKLTNAGWRSNFPTFFLSTMADRFKPSFRRAIGGLADLTNAELPASLDPSGEKTKRMQSAFTRLIKSWAGFGTFQDQIISQNILLGYAACGYLDEVEWRPRAWKVDEAFFQQRAGQSADEHQAFAVELEIMPDALARMVGPDMRIAEDNGWNVENVVQAISAACPKKQDEGRTLEYENAIRESTLGSSAENKANTVTVRYVIAKELDGTASLFVIDKAGNELRRGSFPSISDTLSIFTIESGNGTMTGSKGVGRYLVNLAVAIERSRCLAMDSVYLSGLMKMQADDSNAVQLRVAHPFFVISGDAELIKQTEGLNFNVDSYLALDNKLTSLGEQIIGIFMPNQTTLSGASRKTATEASIDAQRESRIEESLEARFARQWFLMTDMVKRRVFSEENISEAIEVVKSAKLGNADVFLADERQAKAAKAFAALSDNGAALNIVSSDQARVTDPEAVETCVALLQSGITPLDLYIFGQAKSKPEESELARKIRESLLEFSQRWLGSPYLSKKALFDLDAKMTVGADILEKIRAGNAIDEEEAITQARNQMIEYSAMEGGMEVPVSGNDIHGIHLETLAAILDPILDSPSHPAQIEQFKSAISHAVKHAEIAKESEPEAAAKAAEWIKGAVARIGAAQKQAVAAAESAGAGIAGLIEGAGQAPAPEAFAQPAPDAPKTFEPLPIT